MHTQPLTREQEEILVAFLAENYVPTRAEPGDENQPTYRRMTRDYRIANDLSALSEAMGWEKSGDILQLEQLYAVANRVFQLGVHKTRSGRTQEYYYATGRWSDNHLITASSVTTTREKRVLAFVRERKLRALVE